MLPDDPKLNPSSKLVIPSEEILKGSREVLIRHADVLYRLCLTKNGKLILQK
ncbi:MAG: hemin uptake protein HemP [Planctomycetaceae bacterium]